MSAETNMLHQENSPKRGRFGAHTFVWAPEWNARLARQFLPRAAEAGLGVVEIPLLRPDEFDPAGARRLAKEFNLSLTCSLGLPRQFALGADPDGAARFLATAVEKAHAAGSPCLTGVTYGVIGCVSGAPPTKSERAAAARLLSRAARKAKDLGMSIGAEPCNRYETHLLNSAADAVELIERAGEPNIFAHLDTYHMNIEERDIPAAIVRAAPRLGYIHLSESHRGVPGEGTVNWDEVFKALASIKYDGFLIVESFARIHPDIARGLAIWRPVADNPDDIISRGVPFLRKRAARNKFTL